MVVQFVCVRTGLRIRAFLLPFCFYREFAPVFLLIPKNYPLHRTNTLDMRSITRGFCSCAV